MHTAVIEALNVGVLFPPFPDQIDAGKMDTGGAQQPDNQNNDQTPSNPFQTSFGGGNMAMR